MKLEYFSKVNDYLFKIKCLNLASKVTSSALKQQLIYRLLLEICTMMGLILESIYNKVFIELIRRIG